MLFGNEAASFKSSVLFQEQRFCLCRDFLSGLSDDSVLLLLNEAVGQLAVSSDSAVGGASVRLILIMAGQQELRVHSLLLSFRGQRSHVLLCLLYWTLQHVRLWSDNWIKFTERSEVTLSPQVWTAYWTKTGGGVASTRMWISWLHSSNLIETQGVTRRCVRLPVCVTPHFPHLCFTSSHPSSLTPAP